MKVLGTNIFLSGDKYRHVVELGGDRNNRNQFRIICKCRGLKNANEKCAALGLGKNVFSKSYTSETGNKKELKLCEESDVWICIKPSGIINGSEWIKAEDL